MTVPDGNGRSCQTLRAGLFSSFVVPCSVQPEPGQLSVAFPAASRTRLMLWVGVIVDAAGPLSLTPSVNAESVVKRKRSSLRLSSRIDTVIKCKPGVGTLMLARRLRSPLAWLTQPKRLGLPASAPQLLMAFPIARLGLPWLAPSNRMWKEL